MVDRAERSAGIIFLMLFGILLSLISPVSADEVDNYPEGDAWILLELKSWEGNDSDVWDNDGSPPDPQFRVCVDADGDNIDCFNSPTWDNNWTLGAVWNLTFDIPDDSSIINLTIECEDNDVLNDDECDMNPIEGEWKLYFEFNWTTTTQADFSGDGRLDNDTSWREAASNWSISVTNRVHLEETNALTPPVWEINTPLDESKLQLTTSGYWVWINGTMLTGTRENVTIKAALDSSMLDDGYHGCQDNNLAYGYCADVQSLGDGDSFAMRLKITESFCHHYLETTLDAPCETVFLKIVEGDGQTWIMYQTINISTSFRFFDDYYLDKGLVHDSSSNEESDVSLMATCLFPCCIVLLVLGLVIYYIDHREGKKKQKTIRFQQPRQTMPSPSSELILLQPSTTFSSSGEVRSGEVRTSLMQPSTFSSPPTQIRQPVSQEPNVDMSGVIAELENQKIRAESEAHRLNEQLKQQATTASELERMKNEMAALQQQASRHSAEKERLEKEEREWRIPLKHEHATEDYSMKGGREGSRLTSSQQGSDKIVSTLERLAVDENPEVKMLAIEKLAEIHSLNVEAQDRAYIDEKNKS